MVVELLPGWASGWATAGAQGLYFVEMLEWVLKLKLFREEGKRPLRFEAKS